MGKHSIPEVGEGLWLLNFWEWQTTTLIERIRRLWITDGIWTKWVRKRYVVGRALDGIQGRYGDPAQWKETLGSG